MKSSFLILLDCDGVIADFLTPTLEFVKNKTGQEFTHTHITEWDIFKSIGMADMWKDFHEFASKKNFCAKIKPYTGSQAGVARLRLVGDVYVVTSPLATPHWCFERTQWCEKHFELGKPNVIHAEAKYMVMGDVLIDDKYENILSWVATNPYGTGLLFDRPYNQMHECGEGNRIVRVKSWEEILLRVEKIKLEKIVRVNAGPCEWGCK